MRLRFSLRLLLILFTQTAILFGAGANFAWSIKQKAMRHKAAVAKLQQFYFGVQTDDDEDEAYFKSKTPWIEFARQWIDKDAYRACRGIFANQEKKLSPSEMDEAINSMKDLHGVEVIYLGADRLTVKFMQSLAPHTKTTKLTLFYDSAEPGAEKLLCQFPNLEKLELFATAGDDAFTSLRNPDKIKELYVDASKLTKTSGKAIAAMSALMELTITGDLQDPAVFHALARCAKLQSIDFYDCSISGHAASAIGQLDQVHRIETTSDCLLPPNFFVQIAKMDRLHSIDIGLQLVGASCQFDPLAESKSLTVLSLEDIELNDQTLQLLAISDSVMEITCRGDFSNESLFQFLKANPDRELDIRHSDGRQVIYSMNQGGLTAKLPRKRIFTVNVGVAR